MGGAPARASVVPAVTMPVSVARAAVGWWQ